MYRHSRPRWQHCKQTHSETRVRRGKTERGKEREVRENLERLERVLIRLLLLKGAYRVLLLLCYRDVVL